MFFSELIPETPLNSSKMQFWI